MRSKSLLILLTAALALSCVRMGPDRQTENLLVGLDNYLETRDLYVAQKRNQLAALSKLAQDITDPNLRYNLEFTVAQEYFAFSFDSTQVYLKHCQQLAGTNQERYDEASIALGHLYEKAGNYMEAYTLLYEQLDSTRLSRALLPEYLWVLYDFSHDLAGNSGMVERLSIPSAASYREQLMPLLPVNSERWRVLLRDGLIEAQDWPAADSVAHILLSGTRPDEHNYAIHAFFCSEIAGFSGRPADRMKWLVESAKSDILCSVKDYASLTMVAQNILPVDVNRSFRYLRIAQEDALFYNAKLRPWQISRFLIEVEDAYSQRQAVNRKLTYAVLGIMAVLAVAMSLLSRFAIVRSRKLSRTRQELEQANIQLASANVSLNALNRQISRADKVKERQIVTFLEGLANQISLIRSEDNRYRNLLKQGKADALLKELSITGRSEKAREEFYESFDRTFLAMYPDFVEQFNALLKEDARVTPPEGRLTTELRIFALIRLGVDDSKKIASMLDYSASTIYNYKVSVKNASLGPRETFEDRVKMIGKQEK